MKKTKSVLIATIMAGALLLGMTNTASAYDAHHPTHVTIETIYDSHGYDDHGYNVHGYNEHGYNSHGYNVHGYNNHGYNASGHYNGHYNSH